jgi:hypothetical protein
MLYSLFKDIQETTKLRISFSKYQEKLNFSVKIMPQVKFGDIKGDLDDEISIQHNHRPQKWIMHIIQNPPFSKNLFQSLIYQRHPCGICHRI